MCVVQLVERSGTDHRASGKVFRLKWVHLQPIFTAYESIIVYITQAAPNATHSLSEIQRLSSTHEWLLSSRRGGSSSPAGYSYFLLTQHSNSAINFHHELAARVGIGLIYVSINKHRNSCQFFYPKKKSFWKLILICHGLCGARPLNN